MGRQYVGARYVPKFFDWNGSAEWRTGVAYEALTIVTFNNASYTSKVPVPPTVGNPANNPQYWAFTGNYISNDQVDQIAANKKALQTPTTVTDPTSKTVLLAGSQGIDYDKLADAIIAKYQGQTLAGKAQSVKSALDTVRSVQDQIIKTEDSSTPCSYSARNFFVYGGKLYKASADFSSVTLTADNISTYAEAQTQTAINALNQSLFNSPDVLASNIPVIKAYPDNSTQSFGTCYKLWYWKVYSTVYVFFDIDKTDTAGRIIYFPIKGYRPYYNNDPATWLTVHGGKENGIAVTVRLREKEVYIIPTKNAHIIGNFSYPAFD